MSLHSAYDSFNSYRGELEQSRSKADVEYAADRTKVRADMISTGQKQGGRNWNKSMAGARKTYDTAMGTAQGNFDKYTTGSSYKMLQDNYDANVTLESVTNDVFGEPQNKPLADDVFNQLKPTFEEFNDMQFGNSDTAEQSKGLMNRRRTNVLEMRGPL